MRIILRLLVVMLMTISAGCSLFRKGTSSDTVILPLGGQVAVTEGTAVYALPLTVFEVTVAAVRTVEVPGPYARYAGDMLGLDDVIMERKERWKIGSVDLKITEELDPSQFYVIQGTSLMQTNLLALKKSGLILDINPDLYSDAGNSSLFGESETDRFLFPDRGAHKYFATRTDTAYKIIRADTAFIRVPYLIEMKKMMTLEEEARDASERLLELREGKHFILTGETNIFPQDRAAIDEINRLDSELTALFAGKSWSETRYYRIWFIPEASASAVGKTIFSFSETTGLMPADSKTGIPVRIELTPTGKTRELKTVSRPVATGKEIRQQDKLYYRVPDVAEIRITAGNETIYSGRGLIYQFGEVVTLPSNIIIGR